MALYVISEISLEDKFVDKARTKSTAIVEQKDVKERSLEFSL